MTMKKILVTGASGQIGSELIPALRERYGDENVVAGMHRQPLTPDVRDGGPWTAADVTDRGQLDDAMARFGIDTVFHLASVLLGCCRQYRQTAYAVNFNGLFNVLESAVAHGATMVVSPSSIAAFGPETPPVLAERHHSEAQHRLRHFQGVR
jgi:nucleoside-diphosphate-sugar epimerase